MLFYPLVAWRSIQGLFPKGVVAEKDCIMYSWKTAKDQEMNNRTQVLMLKRQRQRENLYTKISNVDRLSRLLPAFPRKEQRDRIEQIAGTWVARASCRAARGLKSQEQMCHTAIHIDMLTQDDILGSSQLLIMTLQLPKNTRRSKSTVADGNPAVSATNP